MPLGATKLLKRRRRPPARRSAGALPLRVRVFFTIFRRALVSTYRDGCLSTAKGAAYSALLAFFPTLATAATILLHFRADFVTRQMYNFLSEILPPGTQDLVFYYFAVRGKQPFLLPVTGMLVSMWAGSGVIVSLMEGFRDAYRVPSDRAFLPERALALALVISAAIPVVGASALILFGTRIEHSALHRLGLLPIDAEIRGWLLVLSWMTRYVIALGAIVSGATVLYYFGPNRPQRWRRVWRGAVVATALWLVATLLFAWYVRNIARYNVLYGSIAAVILLLVWMYVLAIIAFIGCEFNAEHEKMKS